VLVLVLDCGATRESTLQKESGMPSDSDLKLITDFGVVRARARSVCTSRKKVANERVVQSKD